jgi:hypothetical protein
MLASRASRRSGMRALLAVIKSDHFKAPLTPAMMTEPPTAGNGARPRKPMSSVSGTITH